jgi:hypothetical protein
MARIGGANDLLSRGKEILAAFASKKGGALLLNRPARILAITNKEMRWIVLKN